MRGSLGHLGDLLIFGISNPLADLDILHCIFLAIAETTITSVSQARQMVTTNPPLASPSQSRGARASRYRASRARFFIAVTEIVAPVMPSMRRSSR